MSLKLVEQIQHLPNIAKDAGDTLSIGGLLIYAVNLLTPVLEFVVIVATAGWFILRFIDLAWNLLDRWKKRS